jgi:hypothetical protein
LPNLEVYGMEEISSVYKKFLRELPEPILTDSTADNVLQLEVKALIESNKSQGTTKSVASEDPQIIAVLPLIIKKLSPFRRALLKEVFFLLHLIHRKSEFNLMNTENLATIFGTNFCLLLTSTGGMINILSSVMNSFDKCRLCKILVKEYSEIFKSIDTLPLGIPLVIMY